MKRMKQILIALLRALLPVRARNAILHLAFHVARDEFDKFAHLYNFAPHMKYALEEMAERGVLPKTVIDVGSFEGSWAQMARKIWPQCDLVMIEPNYEKSDVLQRVSGELGRAMVVQEVLGAQNGTSVEFNLMSTGSSVLAERSAVPRITERRILKTLDAVVPNPIYPVFLKIDAQGYELEILRGATNVLEKAETVLLEIAVIEINEQAPLLHDVVQFMKDINFVTYDIVEIHRRPLDGALNQIDVIFVREESPLISDKRHYA